MIIYILFFKFFCSGNAQTWKIALIITEMFWHLAVGHLH